MDIKAFVFQPDLGNPSELGPALLNLHVRKGLFITGALLTIDIKGVV
jgi:hypothetical protein